MLADIHQQNMKVVKTEVVVSADVFDLKILLRMKNEYPVIKNLIEECFEFTQQRIKQHQDKAYKRLDRRAERIKLSPALLRINTGDTS